MNRLRGWFVAVAVAVVAAAGLAQAASAATFQPGDLLLQDDLYSPDEIRWLRVDGSFVGSIPGGGHLAFDGRGRLYSMETFSRHVIAYGNDGSPLGTHIEIPGTCNDASGLTFDAVGNAYVGEFAACPGDGLRKFGPTGVFLAYPFPQSFEADFIDLASDQCTLYAMDANRRAVRKTNVCTGEVAGFFGIGLVAPESHEIRVVPDGSVLSNFHGVIFRHSPEGQLLQVIEQPQQCDGEPFVYDPADDDWNLENVFRGLTLGQTGETFWSSCRIGGVFTPLEIRVDSEAVVRSLSGENGFVSAVAGGFYAAHDHAAPTIQIQSPTDGAVYGLGEAVSAQYACADAGGSGLASCVGTVPSGALLDTSSVGPKTFTVTAADAAGNTTSRSVSYRVGFAFSGFFESLDNRPTVNVLSAGKSVRVVFSLGGNSGLAIFQPGFPTSHWMSCDRSAPQDKVEETTRARPDSLTYDAATGRYAYVFRTYRAWSKNCRELVLRFVDGSQQSVLFRLT